MNCLPGGDLTRFEASKLCRRVGQLFENQGARVRTIAAEGTAGVGFEEPEGGSVAPEDRTDLSVVLRSRAIAKASA